MNLRYRKTHLWLHQGQNLPALDLRALLVRVGSNVPTTTGATFLSDFTTLKECDAPEYVRKALTGEALTENAGADRLEYDSADADWGTLSRGPSGESVAGMLLFFQLGGGTDAENRPLIWLDSMASGPYFPYPLLIGGGPFKILAPASGWAHILGPL